MEAALEVFSVQGFRGSTIDQIAETAGMSKPNLLYYFPNKESIHRELLTRLLSTWLLPLEIMDPGGDPKVELGRYIQRKLEMARLYPRESRLFANEVLRGAPHIQNEMNEDLKNLVANKAQIINDWIAQGKMAPCNPYHLIFAIWATTQHYADFDAQIRVILGEQYDQRFEDANQFLGGLFSKFIDPR